MGPQKAIPRIEIAVVLEELLSRRHAWLHAEKYCVASADPCRINSCSHNRLKNQSGTSTKPEWDQY